MRLFILLITCVLCISCGEDVKITVVNDDITPGKVIFNDEDTLVPTGIIDSVFLAKNKKHKIFYNGKEDFFYSNKGGILNLGKKEFVVIELHFESTGPQGNPFGGAYIQLPNFTIIDSSLIYKSKFARLIKDENDLQAIVDSVMSRPNNNYSPDLFGTGRYLKGHDSDKEVHEFKKIGSQTLFIEKFWDYDLGAAIPEEIQVRISSENARYNVNQDKRAILLAEHFLALAQGSPYEYIVVDVRELLRKKKS